MSNSNQELRRQGLAYVRVNANDGSGEFYEQVIVTNIGSLAITVRFYNNDE